MGKPLRKAKHGKDSSGQRLPSVALFFGGSVVVALIAWLCFRGEGRSLEDPVAEPEETDERLDLVRSNLFSASGGSRFDPSSGGAAAESRSALKRSFSDASYWDERYSKKPTVSYDWYGTWDSQSALTIKGHVSHLMPAKSSAILNIGCGNSRFPEELSDDGYTQIMSIDISQVAVDAMSKRLGGRTGLRFLQMDATNMSFADASFDVVFEKGTLDALYSGGAALVSRVVAEVFRVLRRGGLFVSMSFGAPGSRTELNATADEGAGHGWHRFQSVALKRDSSDGSDEFFLYLMSKSSG